MSAAPCVLPRPGAQSAARAERRCPCRRTLAGPHAWEDAHVSATASPLRRSRQTRLPEARRATARGAARPAGRASAARIPHQGNGLAGITAMTPEGLRATSPARRRSATPTQTSSSSTSALSQARRHALQRLHTAAMGQRAGLERRRPLLFWSDIPNDGPALARGGRPRGAALPFSPEIPTATRSISRAGRSPAAGTRKACATSRRQSHGARERFEDRSSTPQAMPSCIRTTARSGSPIPATARSWNTRATPTGSAASPQPIRKEAITGSTTAARSPKSPKSRSSQTGSVSNNYKRLYVADTGKSLEPAKPIISMFEVDGASSPTPTPSPAWRWTARPASPTESAATRTATFGRAPLVGDGFDGVHVFSPDGQRIGQIRLPEICSNVCFGGPSATGSS